MLFKKTVAVYCENHTEHINTLCGQNVELFNIKAGGTHSDCALDKWFSTFCILCPTIQYV
jgi:hypothetical protein